jgi:hemerythrin
LPSFNWSATYAVFVPEIDAEHRTLFRLAQDLRRAMIADAASVPMQSLLDDLLTHTA